MFEVVETTDLHRQKQLLFVSIVIGILCFSIIFIEYLLGNHVFRPGYTIAGIASVFSVTLIAKEKYKYAVYLCSLSFASALGAGILFGPGLRNIVAWFPVFMFFHFYFFNRKMTVISAIYCYLLFGAKIVLLGKTERSEFIVDSLASLGVLTFFILSIGADLDKLLSDRESLVRELSSRVRNTLQIVLDLVFLLKDSNHSLDTKITLETLERRIDALSSIHEVSGNSEDIRRISIGEVVEIYLNRIIAKSKAIPEIDPLGKHFLLDVKDANLLLLVLGEIISSINESVTTHIEEVQISFTNPSTKTVGLEVEGANLSEGEWSKFSRLLLRQYGGDLKLELNRSGKITAIFEISK